MTDPSGNSETTTAEAREQRSSPRHKFPYLQKIAPMADGKVPAAAEFYDVRCRDLSGRGISIVLDEPPEFDHLVVALGRAPDLSHVTARVVRVEPFDHAGVTKHLVGCQFIGRASL
jgi:hypothetical protein